MVEVLGFALLRVGELEVPENGLVLPLDLHLVDVKENASLLLLALEDIQQVERAVDILDLAVLPAQVVDLHGQRLRLRVVVGEFDGHAVLLQVEGLLVEGLVEADSEDRRERVVVDQGGRAGRGRLRQKLTSNLSVFDDAQRLRLLVQVICVVEVVEVDELVQVELAFLEQPESGRGKQQMQDE